MVWQKNVNINYLFLLKNFFDEFIFCQSEQKNEKYQGVIMGNIEELISKLNSDQIKPVLDTEGAVLVVAGAGSGKTSVLTTRIANLVLKKGVSPYNILAITFTNKAANEMKERLSKVVGDISGMWVSTIHSMCVKILRSSISLLGYDKNFTIYDETDKEKALKRVIEDLKLKDDKLLKIVKNAISAAKNDCFSPDEWKKENSDYGKCESVYAVYKGYEELLFRSNALDFDDLLYKTYQLFVEHPEVADYYADKFHYIHIDEFQDTNKVQYLIARRLALKHGNIFVVGDEDQSIYSWRGARVENILDFEKQFGNAKVYKLEKNYRSTKKILQLANSIIENNKLRRHKKLWTDNEDGVRVETFIGNDENNEAQFVALQIKNLMQRTDMNYGDFAVFMRINALSRAFEQEFTKYGIPYRIYGGFRFFERKEIKDLLAYVKVVVNPRDDESFIRAVTTPKRGIGEKSISELREYAVARGLGMRECLEDLTFAGFSSGTVNKFLNFKTLLDEFSVFATENDSAKLLKHIIETTSFNELFAEKTEENRARIMNVNELINVAELFHKDNPESTVSDFVNSVTLSSDTDDINDGNQVTVATIHAVKGLEFPCVFVSGLDESILPVSTTDDDEIEEERRLMYVAVTRAKKRLYLTRASSRYLYGSRNFMRPSRFLKEGQLGIYGNQEEKRINTDYRSETVIKTDADIESSDNIGYSSGYAKTFLNKSVNKGSGNVVNFGQYKSGVKVNHVKFGEGTVIATKGEGDNLIVDVAFKGVGIKSLSVKYAPMKIVK